MSAPTDEDLAALATLMSMGVLEPMAKLARRFKRVPEFWSDLSAELELVERLNLPGVLPRGIHHDGKGEVYMVEMGGKKRQGRSMPAKRTA